MSTKFQGNLNWVVIFHVEHLWNDPNVSSNRAKYKGGGVYATNSLITCTEPYRQAKNTPYQNILIFMNNSARLGGGVYLTSAAQLRIQKAYTSPYNNPLNTSIYFISNFAQNGTAIYVDDEMYPYTCDGSYNLKIDRDNSSNQCFFQVFSRISALGKMFKQPNIGFTTKHRGNNSASSVIFGGLLDRCIPDPRRAEIITSGAVYNRWTGLVDWTSGLDCWTDRFSFKTHI